MKEQLLAWEMVSEIGDYELEAERTGARDSEDQQTAFELDTIIRVMAGEKVYLEMKQTKKIGKIGA